MSWVIALFNQCGGVGKSTLTMNLGYHLQERSHRVLLIDMDPQASLTIFMGLEPEKLNSTVSDVLADEDASEELSFLPIHKGLHGLDLTPSSINLSATELALVNADMRDVRLKDALSPVRDLYDFILIDCPPSLGLLSYISLVAATHILVPIQTQFKAFEGTNLLLKTVAGGDETYRVARDAAQNKVRDLQERYKYKQNELDYLKIVRPGRVAYLGTALVHPASVEVSSYPGMRNDPEVEAFAMQYVMDYERQRGWEPEDVSKNRDGSGFDIRSVGPVDPETGIAPVRRIEVKGRAQCDLEISLTVNEWCKAQQLGDSYWLYVVWGCKTPNPELLKIPNPARVLAGDAKEIKQVTRYIVGAEALQQGAISDL